MDFEEVYREVEDIGGWMSEEDCRVLFDEASRVRGMIVEIGSYKGKSTKTLALASPESWIIAIDPYPKNYYEETDMEKVKKEFLSNTKGLNITLIQKFSATVGKAWEDKIDLLHIDGNHSYRSVKGDIELFVPHVKKGGVVLFHDYLVVGDPKEVVFKKDNRYYSKHYGVVRVLNEEEKRFRKIDIVEGFARCLV